MKHLRRGEIILRNYLNRTKNRILYGVTAVMSIIFVLSACALDSPSIVPGLIGVVVSSFWWLCFLYANDWNILR